MVEKLTKRMRVLIEGPALWIVIVLTIIVVAILLTIGILQPDDIKDVLNEPPAVTVQAERLERAGFKTGGATQGKQHAAPQ